LVDKLLEKGYEVVGIDCFSDYYPREIKEKNISKALNSENFTLIERDILKMEVFPEGDYIFHLAAQAGVRSSWGKNFEIYSKNNIEATQKLLDFYVSKEIKKFVYASSSSVYGDAPLPMREDSPLNPISPYGVTKLAGENLCYLYHKNLDLPTVSLRYFTVYGPRQRPDMAIHKFVKAILSGKEITIYGDGEQTRDFTYVSDTIDATIRAAEKDFALGVFNIGGGSKISVNELIFTIEDIVGSRAIINYTGRQKGDAKATLADVRRACEILGWKPKVDILTGIKKYVEEGIRDDVRYLYHSKENTKIMRLGN
jgi:UDP-glucose 4-epimerase